MGFRDCSLTNNDRMLKIRYVIHILIAHEVIGKDNGWMRKACDLHIRLRVCILREWTILSNTDNKL